MNLRGSDIEYNPVFFSYAVVTLNDLLFFVDSKKLPANFENHFQSNNTTVIIHQYENVHSVVKQLIDESATGKIWISSTSSYALTALVPPKRIVQDVNSIFIINLI